MLSVISFSSFSQNSKALAPVSKTVNLTEAYSSLLIENNLSVILTESASPTIKIEGDARDVKKVGVFVTDGQLVLTYAQPNLQPDVKLYVPAAFLTKVFMNGKAMLSSSAVLKNKKLKIYMAEEGQVNIRSVGSVIVEPDNEIDFVKTR
jgi:hypothetical protein